MAAMRGAQMANVGQLVKKDNKWKFIWVNQVPMYIYTHMPNHFCQMNKYVNIFYLQYITEIVCKKIIVRVGIWTWWWWNLIKPRRVVSSNSTLNSQINLIKVTI